MPAHKKVREKNCIVCGNVFTAICQKTLDKRQFCSHRCQGDNEHRQLINEMLGMDVKCQQCGIPMTAISVNILKKKRFCSHACCGKYELDHKISGIITKGGHHTEATCERFREIGKQRDMTRMSNEAVVSKWLKDRGQTKQEKRLERWLQEEHMSYKFVGDGQLCIASYWPDFINTNGDNIIIELSEPTRNASKIAVYTALGYVSVFISRQLVQYGQKETAIARIRHAETEYHKYHGRYIEPMNTVADSQI